MPKRRLRPASSSDGPCDAADQLLSRIGFEKHRPNPVASCLCAGAGLLRHYDGGSSHVLGTQPSSSKVLIPSSC